MQELRGEVRKLFMHFPPKLALMTVVTRCQILRLKCTKFDFRWGFAPDPGVGACSAPLGPLVVCKEAYF